MIERYYLPGKSVIFSFYELSRCSNRTKSSNSRIFGRKTVRFCIIFILLNPIIMNPILSTELSILAITLVLIIVKVILFQKNFPGSPFAQWFHLDNNHVYKASDNSKVEHARKIQNNLTFIILMLLFALWMFWLLNKD